MVVTALDEGNAAPTGARSASVYRSKGIPPAGSLTGMAFPDLVEFGGGSDSRGFGRIPSSPARGFHAAFHRLYGHFDPTEKDSGLGRIR